MFKYALTFAFTVASAASAASAASGTPTAPADLDAYTFEEFKLAFGKKYASAAEEAGRKAVFDTALAEARMHNAKFSKGEVKWHQGINQFSDITPEEFRDSHGWVSSRGLEAKGALSYMEDPDFHVPAGFDVKSLPKNVDWRTKGVVSPIKNQGMCGSCWAFGSTENIESHVALAMNATTAPVLSPQNLVSCDPNPKHCGGKGGCRGSIPELAFDWVKAHGLASEADYPYVSGHTSLDEPCKTTVKPSAHILGYTKLKSNNYTEVMYALATRGPVAVNVDAIPMQSYGGGMMTACAIDKTHIDHVVQLVGYGYDPNFDLNYWWLRNSWGTTWGIDGYMKLQRHDPNENWCSIDIYPADGTGCDGGPGTVNTCGSCGVLYDVSYPIGGSMA